MPNTGYSLEDIAQFGIRENLERVIDRLVEEGLMIEGARGDMMAYQSQFSIYEGRPIHTITGRDAETFVRTEMLPLKLHWHPVEFTDVEETAFGSAPTLAARAAYLRNNGPDKYDFEMARWGCSPMNLKPGTRPATGADKTTKNETSDLSDKRNNPWLHLRNPKTGAIDERSQARCNDIVKRLGTAKAAAFARAAHVTLSGQPLPVGK